MEKLAYLTWKRPALSIDAYRRHLLEEPPGGPLDAGARRLDVNVSDLLGTLSNAALRVHAALRAALPEVLP